MKNEKIKSMKLYNFIDRVYNELKELGKENSEDLSTKELSSFDQLHYHGTDAIDYVIQKFQINSNSKVLEIGSGIGGPSRYIAEKTGAQVIALELQYDHHDIGEKLTKRCKLEKNLEHICGDFLTYDFGDRNFDCIVSWLALYHIPDRTKLLQKSLKLLSSGGYFFAEDFAYHKPFNEHEVHELSSDFYANYIVSYDNYINDLRNAGFVEIESHDMTKSWSDFTKLRFKSYNDNIARHIRVHNQEIVDNMLDFYSFAMRYLDAGKLGGIKISARKN